MTIDECIESESFMMGREVTKLRFWETDVSDHGGTHTIQVLIYDASTETHFQTRMAVYVDDIARFGGIVDNGTIREGQKS